MQSNISFTFRIAPELLERVRREAERNRRLVGAEMMALIEAALAARGPSKRGAPNAVANR
jgi:hypothetical protein